MFGSASHAHMPLTRLCGARTCFFPSPTPPTPDCHHHLPSSYPHNAFLHIEALSSTAGRDCGVSSKY